MNEEIKIYTLEIQDIRKGFDCTLETAGGDSDEVASVTPSFCPVAQCVMRYGEWDHPAIVYGANPFTGKHSFSCEISGLPYWPDSVTVEIMQLFDDLLGEYIVRETLFNIGADEFLAEFDLGEPVVLTFYAAHCEEYNPYL